MSPREADLLKKFNSLPQHEQDSLMLLAVEQEIEAVGAEQNALSLQNDLDKHVVKAYSDADTFALWQFRMDNHEILKADFIKDGAWDLYRKAIGRHGNPDDQIENFQRAGIILQDKQLEFAAAARRADIGAQANEIGMGGARGPGKSFGIFAQVTVDDCQRFPGLKVLYLRKSGKAAS